VAVMVRTASHDCIRAMAFLESEPRVLAPVKQAARFLSAKARREGQDVFLVWLCFGDKKVCQSEKASRFKTLTSTVSHKQEKTK